MLHFGEIPKKIVKFGENSANFGQIWANLRNFGEKTAKNSAIFNGNFEIRERFLPFRGCFGQALFPHFSPMDSKAVQGSALCRSRRELSNEYLLAKFGFDTAENEPI